MIYDKYLALYTALKELAQKNKEEVHNKVGLKVSIENKDDTKVNNLAKPK